MRVFNGFIMQVERSGDKFRASFKKHESEYFRRSRRADRRRTTLSVFSVWVGVCAM